MECFCGVELERFQKERAFEEEILKETLKILKGVLMVRKRVYLGIIMYSL